MMDMWFYISQLKQNEVFTSFFTLCGFLFVWFLMFEQTLCTSYFSPIGVCFHSCLTAWVVNLNACVCHPLFQEDPVPSWTKPCDKVWPKGMHAPESACSNVSQMNFASLHMFVTLFIITGTRYLKRFQVSFHSDTEIHESHLLLLLDLVGPVLPSRFGGQL